MLHILETQKLFNIHTPISWLNISKNVLFIKFQQIHMMQFYKKQPNAASRPELDTFSFFKY